MVPEPFFPKITVPPSPPPPIGPACKKMKNPQHYKTRESHKFVLAPPPHVGLTTCNLTTSPKEGSIAIENRNKHRAANLVLWIHVSINTYDRE